jgi:tyrosyl-tRNA synthetase
MYGKLMGISDELMWRYFELLSLKVTPSSNRSVPMLSQGSVLQCDKALLAKELITRFHTKMLPIAHQKVLGINSKRATFPMRCRR